MSRLPRVLLLLGALAILPAFIGCSKDNADDAPVKKANSNAPPPTKDAGQANSNTPMNSGAVLPPPPGWKKPGS